MKKSSAFPWKYGLFLASYYLANAVYQGYASKYFESTGVTHAQLTILLTAAPAISILMQPLWGTIGDRARLRNNVLRLMIVFSALIVLTYRISGTFWYLLIASTLFSAFYTSVQPMGDSIILESLQHKNQPFGPLRLMGCVTFAVGNLFIGYAVEGRMNLVLYLTAAVLMLTLLCTRALPPTPGHQSTTGRKMNPTGILRLPHMKPLIIMLMLMQLTMGYFYSFYSPYFTSLEGGSTTILGWCYFLSAMSEVPFLLNADKLFEKLGVGKLMSICAAALTCRWLLLGSFANIYVAAFSQVLHGWGFIVMTVSMSKYMSAIVPDELKASGQMLLALVGFGIARVFGILGGGLLSEHMGGTQQGFLMMAAVSGIALIVFAPKFFKMKPLNGHNES